MPSRVRNVQSGQDCFFSQSCEALEGSATYVPKPFLLPFRYELVPICDSSAHFLFDNDLL